MAPKRLTRREIVQQDQIQTALTRIWSWIARNRVFLTVAIAGILVLLTGAFLWEQRERTVSEELQSQFAEILDRYYAISEEPEEEEEEAPSGGEASGGEVPETGTAQQGLEEVLAQFQALAEDHPDTRVGQFSRYYMGLVKDRLGRTEEAEAELSALVESTSDAEIRSLALAVLARLAREKDNLAKTKDLLERILAGDSQYFPKDSVLLLLGQYHESAGEVEEALRSYRQIATEHPESPYLKDAQAAISRLEESAGH